MTIGVNPIPDAGMDEETMRGICKVIGIADKLVGDLTNERSRLVAKIEGLPGHIRLLKQNPKVATDAYAFIDACAGLVEAVLSGADVLTCTIVENNQSIKHE